MMINFFTRCVEWMMVIITWIAIAFVAFGMIASTASAHGGGLDRQGGHRHTATNTYHCHRCGGSVRSNPTGKHLINKDALRIDELEQKVEILRLRVEMLENRINNTRDVIQDYMECIKGNDVPVT